MNVCVTLGVYFPIPSLSFTLLYFIPLFLALSSFELLISSTSLALACFRRVQPYVSSRSAARVRDPF